MPAGARLGALNGRQAEMKKVLTLGFAALLAFGLAGCKSDEEKFVSMMEDEAKAIESAGDDCEKVAKALTEFKKEKKPQLKELKKKLKEKYKGDKEKEKEIKEKYKDRMEKATKSVLEAYKKCASNKGFQDAMKAGAEDKDD
jgi:hypothetical protein